MVGGIQFVMTSSNRRYTDADVALAQVVAGRIASSLENRRLSEEQHHIAVTLQTSLLPDELPVIPGVDLAVRYWAAGEGVVTGGDFYDVLDLGADRWGVVIGDVCGTGPAAAAVTGLARHTIASAAWHGDSPGNRPRTAQHHDAAASDAVVLHRRLRHGGGRQRRHVHRGDGWPPSTGAGASRRHGQDVRASRHAHRGVRTGQAAS